MPTRPIVDAITRSTARSSPAATARRHLPRRATTTRAATLRRRSDLVLFQVKGFATAAAADRVRAIVGPHTIVLTLQNGLGNEEVLRAAYPNNACSSASRCTASR